MMNDVFSLRGHDVPWRSVFETELPFPDTENPAGEGFLIGNNRPIADIPADRKSRYCGIPVR